MPLQLYRFDWMQGNADGRAHLRGGQQVKLQHPVSYYFRNNIWITTSGVAWEPAIKFCMEQLGPRAGALRDGLPLPAVLATRSPPTTACSSRPSTRRCSWKTTPGPCSACPELVALTMLRNCIRLA